jgi:CheY-like chemotaxis protein
MTGASNATTNLLIVEENRAMCGVIRSVLEGLPVSVTECHDGTQALATCVDLQPDWILLDLDLTTADALAATREIGVRCPKSRVIALIENDNSRLRDAARRAGAWTHVLKENLIDLRRLLRHVE